MDNGRYEIWNTKMIYALSAIGLTLFLWVTRPLPKGLGFLLVTLASLAVGTVYFYLGKPGMKDYPAVWLQEHALSKKRLRTEQKRLRAYLHAHPHDCNAWKLYHKTLKGLEQTQEAHEIGAYVAFMCEGKEIPSLKT